MIANWPCPDLSGGTASEHAFAIDRDRPARLLIVPALFDEGNRLRRQTVLVQRELDRAGVDSFLIDLPGTNESLQPLNKACIEDWRAAVSAAATHFAANHVLALRGGAVALPGEPPLPCTAFAPTSGASILRQMVRMRVISAREAAREESAADLMAQGRSDGLVLAGYPLGAAMIRQLEDAAAPAHAGTISQGDIGGAALWLRAEAGEDPAQAAALAALAAKACTA